MVCCIIDESLTMSRVSKTLCTWTDKPVYHSNGFWRGRWVKSQTLIQAVIS